MAIQITSFRMSGVLLYFGFLLPLAFVHSVVFLGAIVWRLVFPSDLTNKVKLWLWGVYCYWLTDKLLYPTFSHFYSAGHSLQFKDYWVWRWSFLRESPYVFLGLLGPEGKATTILPNVGIYLPTDNAVASRKTWIVVNAMTSAAVQKFSVAFSIMAINNATWQLGRWFLVRGQIINVFTYCVSMKCLLFISGQ